MEREVLMTGIGGQGIQLAAQMLARAALAEGREVQLFGSYGGMMRGGNTDTTLVVADAPIESPPTIDRAWAGIVMHGQYAEPLLGRVRPDGVLFLNSSLVKADDIECPGRIVAIAATDLAVDVGNIMVASMVMIGAFAASTGFVSLPVLRSTVAAALPAYRAQHIELNHAALAAGAAAAPADCASAWHPVGAIR